MKATLRVLLSRTAPWLTTALLAWGAFAQSTLVLPPGRQVTLPVLSEAQLRELVFDIALHMDIAQGYKRIGPDEARRLPPPPEAVMTGAVIARSQGLRRDYIRLGFLQAPRRLPQLWVQSFSIQDNAVVANADGEQASLDPALRTILTERSKIYSRLRISDLESRTLLLSYVDAEAALFALRAMGYSAITDTEALAKDESYRGEEMLADPAQAGMPPGMPAGDPNAAMQAGIGYQAQPAPWSSLPPEDQKRFMPRFPAIKHLPTTIAFDRLPIVVKMPSTDPRNLGLVGNVEGAGAVQAASGQFGLTVVPQAAAPLAETIAGGTAELMVLYHPNYPEQLQQIRRALRDTIDKPARQVYVEGMVLEISSEGLKELGVQWDIRKGDQSWSIGTLVPQLPGGAAFNFIRNTTLNVSPTEITARINALVNSNKAEILSRPSVITLDNRQATIRVGTDIPVATSKDAGGDTASSRVSFNFQYIPTGILMNIRPRISEDTQEISMLIDATVSSTVPGQDLRVLDPASKITLASAPTIATRRVQTYARIRDNMPLIIGGLVSKNRVTGSSRVPILGDIPVLGGLFGYTSNNDTTREVIIVLTPSIVTENVRETKAQYPKDDARFDQLDTALFKEHYRIRAEDLVDSSHFRFNQRFLRYRDAANKVIDRAPELVNREPFAQFAGTKIPGEFIFVTGMMSRMLERQGEGKDIRLENLTYFEQVSPTQQRPTSLAAALSGYGDGKDPASFFAANPGKALAVTFRLGRASLEAADMFTEVTPEVRIVECPDRKVWRQMLWDMNQPDERGRRFTMLFQDKSDLYRAQLAMATQNTMLNNGGANGMIFDRWLPGRMLHFQEVSPTWERVLNAQIAQFFFIGEYYYPYFMQVHTKAIEDLDRALRSTQYAQVTEGIALPPP